MLCRQHNTTPLSVCSWYRFFNPIPFQVLVRHGALVAMANKYGDTPLSKARPRLRKKLEGAIIYIRHYGMDHNWQPALDTDVKNIWSCPAHFYICPQFCACMPHACIHVYVIIYMYLSTTAMATDLGQSLVIVPHKSKCTAASVSVLVHVVRLHVCIRARVSLLNL